MRNATEIVKHVDFSQARPAVQQQPASIDEGTAQVVNALFNELKSIFPGGDGSRHPQDAQRFT